LRLQVNTSLVKLDETCRDIEKTITKKQREYEVARDVMSPEDIREHFASLARLRVRLSDLREKQEQTAQIDADIATVRDRLTRAKAEWGTMSLEQRRAFVRLITEQITLDTLSGRWMKLEITWSPVLMGEAYVERALFLRSSGASPNWTKLEDDVLAEVYPHKMRSDVLTALPRRSWAAIKSRASVLRLCRVTRVVGPVRLHEKLALEDWRLMRSFGITQAQMDAGGMYWWDVLSVSEGVVQHEEW
jgi:hypothetical protein